MSTATIKNRVSQLRYVSKCIGKPNLLPKQNKELGIGKRTYIPNGNKAIHEIDTSKFDNIRIRYSVSLAHQFGLRREEAIKFNVVYADLDDRIRLKDSWTKGGIYREIPITTPEQRVLLNELKRDFGKDQSLIPDNKDYAYQRRVYDRAVSASGYKNLHGLRHAYAQRRYSIITNERTNGNGWQAPLNGGKHRRELSPHEREIDEQARMIVSRELGHARIQITNTYLGI